MPSNDLYKKRIHEHKGRQRKGMRLRTRLFSLTEADFKYLAEQKADGFSGSFLVRSLLREARTKAVPMADDPFAFKGLVETNPKSLIERARAGAVVGLDDLAESAQLPHELMYTAEDDAFMNEGDEPEEDTDGD